MEQRDTQEREVAENKAEQEEGGGRGGGLKTQ